MRLSCNDGLLSVICGDGNCYRRVTVRLGIDTLIASILVTLNFHPYGRKIAHIYAFKFLSVRTENWEI